MPTAVLIHGAWHGAWCWDLVADELGAQGVTVFAPDLPLAGLAADAAIARAALESAGDEVVVCAHSYGGLVVSDAARGLSNVQHIVYLAAFMTDPGERAAELLASHPTALLEALVTTDEGISIDPRRAHEVFYGDSDEVVAASCTSRLRPVSADLGAAVTPPDPAWQTAPATTFVVCTADRAVAPALQRKMATRASSTVEWPVDHSPFLTRPGEIADLIVGCFGSL